jgi:hypothetical protein
MVTIWLSLLGALIVTALFGLARFLLSRRKNMKSISEGFIRWLILLFVLNFVVSFPLLYFGMPALTGPYGGWQWLFWPIFLSGILSVTLNSVVSTQRLVGTVMNRARGSILDQLRRERVINTTPPSMQEMMATGAGSAGIVVIVAALLLVTVGNGIIAAASTWFDPNAKALAAIPNVTTLKDTKLPPTDVNHIVLVTKGIAAYKGQQVLGQSGQNLGSTYHLVQDEYTLQSVNHHLYWIAPLVYNNIFANLGHYDTPGFAVVDAENPDALPQLKTGYHLHYVPDALLNQELTRHVYLSGYTYGDLLDPTLEVDDNWQPYFTVSLMQPSRGFTGEILKKVLLVNPQNGDIKAYDPKDVPSWIDRVMPASVVSDYLGWWGLYEHAPWINFSGTGQQKTASDPELVYNNVDTPVWLVPITSNNTSDNSSTGIMLFDTHQNAATFYQLAGLGVGDTVQSALKSNPANIRAYDVSSVQLYQIFGEPTWVGIFTQQNSQGEAFQAVGLVDARDLNGSNVQFAPSLKQALSMYQQWLAANSSGSNGSPNPGSTEGKVQGKVLRIAPVPNGNSTSYYIQIEGQSAIYIAPVALSPLLPLVQPGDIIQGTYSGTFENVGGVQTVTLTSFTDTSISLPTATPTGAPAATGTPQATASPAPTPTP